MAKPNRIEHDYSNNTLAGYECLAFLGVFQQLGHSLLSLLAESDEDLYHHVSKCL